MLSLMNALSLKFDSFNCLFGVWDKNNGLIISHLSPNNGRTLMCQPRSKNQAYSTISVLAFREDEHPSSALKNFFMKKGAASVKRSAPSMTI